MNHFLGGFLTELEKLGAFGAFVADPPKAAPAGASSKTELEKRQAGGVNSALGARGASVNKQHKPRVGKLDLRALKAKS